MIGRDPFQFVEARSVRVDKLTAPEFVQVRKEFLHEPTVESYATRISQGVDLGPILVAQVEHSDKTLAKALRATGSPLQGPLLVVVDGFHRLAAHRKLGRSHIAARIATCDLATARWIGSRQNLLHGRQLRKADFRRLFRAFMDARGYREGDDEGGWSPMGLRGISRELGGGMAASTIRAWMQKDYPSVYARHYAADNRSGPGEPFHGMEDKRPTGVDAIQSELTAIAKLASALGPADRASVADTMTTLAGQLKPASGP